MKKLNIKNIILLVSYIDLQFVRIICIMNCFPFNFLRTNFKKKIVKKDFDLSFHSRIKILTESLYEQK